MTSHFDKLINSIFGETKHSNSLFDSLKRATYPKLNVVETENKFKVEVGVPGVAPEDVAVEVIDQDDHTSVLRVSGQMRQEKENKDTEYLYRELTTQKFERTIVLPEGVEGEPEAVLKNGLLTLAWNLTAKQAKEKVRKVKITSESLPAKADEVK